MRTIIRVVIVCSGGNIDTSIFGRCLERGLAAEGRLIKFNIEVPDCPGGLNKLCEILCCLGVSIKDIMHERAWLRDVYTVEVSFHKCCWDFKKPFYNVTLSKVKVVCETRDWGHSMELKNKLKETFPKVQFSETPLAIENCQMVQCKKY